MMKKWPNFYNQKANNETQVKSGSLKWSENEIDDIHYD
jgi:hypothetical protein